MDFSLLQEHLNKQFAALKAVETSSKIESWFFDILEHDAEKSHFFKQLIKHFM